MIKSSPNVGWYNAKHPRSDSAARRVVRPLEAIVNMQKTLVDEEKTLCLSFAQLLDFYRILGFCSADGKHVTLFLDDKEHYHVRGGIIFKRCKRIRFAFKMIQRPWSETDNLFEIGVSKMLWNFTLSQNSRPICHKQNYKIPKTL